MESSSSYIKPLGFLLRHSPGIYGYHGKKETVVSSHVLLYMSLFSFFYDDHDHDHVNNDDDGGIIILPRTIQKFIEEALYKTTLFKLQTKSPCVCPLSLHVLE